MGIMRFVIILLLLAGCTYQPTPFKFMGGKHTFTYTAQVLGTIQHDYCTLSDEDKLKVMRRVDRFVEEGWLAMGCAREPRIPVFE